MPTIEGPQPPKSKGIAWGSVNFHRNIRKLNYHLPPWGEEWARWFSDWYEWNRVNDSLRRDYGKQGVAGGRVDLR